MDGFVLVDKSDGPSSFAVAAGVRRALPGKLKTGHGGTLDPFATGLVIVLVGAGTRLMPWVVGHDKRYLLTVQLGAGSDSDDRTGVLTADDRPIQWEGLDVQLELLRNSTQQVPPQVSALHVDGERAYDRARRGETMELPTRSVRFDAIDVVSVDRNARQIVLDVRCASGTYMRSLARDLGAALGSAAHASELRRTEIGEWTVADATPIDQVTASTMRPPGQLIAQLPRTDLDAELAGRFLHGQRIWLGADAQACEANAVYAGDLLLGVARIDDEGVLRPQTVLARPDAMTETGAR